MNRTDRDTSIATSPVAASPIAFSPTGAAQASSIAERRIRRALVSGALPSHRIGRRRIVFSADLADWLRRGGQTAPPPAPADDDPRAPAGRAVAPSSALGKA